MKHGSLLKRKCKRISPFIAASLLLCSNSDMKSWGIAEVEHLTHVEQSLKNVRGKIADVNGNLLVGLNIVLTGKSDGTISDTHGSYYINVHNGA